MKAVKKFKRLIFKKRPDLMDGVLGSSAQLVQPPDRIDLAESQPRNKSQEVLTCRIVDLFSKFSLPKEYIRK